MGPTFVAILFAVLGWGYHNLDREPTKKFLETFYNLDFTGFVNVSTNPKVIVVSYLSHPVILILEDHALN